MNFLRRAGMVLFTFAIVIAGATLILTRKEVPAAEAGTSPVPTPAAVTATTASRDVPNGTVVEPPKEVSDPFIRRVLEFEQAYLTVNLEQRNTAVAPFATAEFLKEFENTESPLNDPTKTLVAKVDMVKSSGLTNAEQLSDGPSAVREVLSVVVIDTFRDGQLVNRAIEMPPHTTTWVNTPDGWKVHTDHGTAQLKE